MFESRCNCHSDGSGAVNVGMELVRDPVVSSFEPLFQGNLRFPLQHFAQARLVAVPTSDTLRLRFIVTLSNILAGETGDDVDQFIDRDHSILAQINWIAMVAAHQTINAFYAVVDVAIGAGLLTIAPDFNFIVAICQRYFAADRRG